MFNLEQLCASVSESQLRQPSPVYHLKYRPKPVDTLNFSARENIHNRANFLKVFLESSSFIDPARRLCYP